MLEKTLAQEMCEENQRMALRMNAPKVGRVYTAAEAQAICERADKILKERCDE
jgi:hypothetical protein